MNSIFILYFIMNTNGFHKESSTKAKLAYDVVNKNLDFVIEKLVTFNSSKLLRIKRCRLLTAFTQL